MVLGISFALWLVMAEASVRELPVTAKTRKVISKVFKMFFFFGTAEPDGESKKMRLKINSNIFIPP